MTRKLIVSAAAAALMLGLRREAYYERFLDIDGAWRDHAAFAITAEELNGRSVVSRLTHLPPAPTWRSAT